MSQAAASADVVGQRSPPQRRPRTVPVLCPGPRPGWTTRDLARGTVEDGTDRISAGAPGRAGRQRYATILGPSAVDMSPIGGRAHWPQAGESAAVRALQVPEISARPRAQASIPSGSDTRQPRGRSVCLDEAARCAGSPPKSITHGSRRCRTVSPVARRTKRRQSVGQSVEEGLCPDVLRTSIRMACPWQRECK